MRRTTSIDVHFPELGAADVPIAVRGRDLSTDAHGVGHQVDSVALELRAELAMGRVTGLDGAAHALNDSAMRAGFRRDLAERLPDLARERTLLYSVLEDMPGAFLVSGYALVREQFWPQDPANGAELARQQVNVCAGWEADRTPHRTLVASGVTPLPYGPLAPALEAEDPDGWHAMPALAIGTVRRRRVLDVWEGHARGHFRDTYAADDGEMVMHEYEFAATTDADRLTSLVVTPRVLPWAECPNAIASAQGVVGLSLDEIGDKVRAEYHGTSTCTHLNSTLKSLADIGRLSEFLQDTARS